MRLLSTSWHNISIHQRAILAGYLAFSANSVRAMSVGSQYASLLKDPSFLAYAPQDVAAFDVFNPSDPEQVVARVPSLTRIDTQAAIQRAEEALEAWRDGWTAAQRAAVLRAWSTRLESNAEDLAILMTLESGKPLRESRGEVNYARSFIDYFAAEAVRPTGAGGGFLAPTPFTHPDGMPKGQIMAIQQAVGVCAVITPWNFPAGMITRHLAPAFAAGCVAILKPSEYTPLTAMALHRLALEAGLPDNVLQIITADRDHAAEIGLEMCINPVVRQIGFTGSVAVGKKLMEQSSATVKRLSLELGGNAVFVVFEDADLELAVNAAVASKFRFAGQTCVCADRFLVHETLYDEFVQKFVERASRLTVGPAMDPSTEVGPLISQDSVARVKARVDGALSTGAQKRMGGNICESLGTHFFEPTVLADVPLESEIWSLETFGPVAAIRSFQSDEEALSIANNSPVGLAGYFCTNDMKRVFKFAKALECGIVGVNEGVVSTCCAPFGGIKESGLGREGSPLGIGEFLETKYIFVNF